ncbi:MAG: acyltransferase [Rikenellaceae bacterium]
MLQGFSMLLVVVGHANLTGVAKDPSHPFVASIEQTIYSFHMPLFMLISGWLFYLTELSKDRQYGAMIKKKFNRFGMPFLFFTISATVLKLIFAPLMKRAVDMNEIIDTFVLFRSNPLGEMWFITTLFILMALYPLYRFALKKVWLEILLFISAILLYFYFPSNIDYFYLKTVAKMMPFFFAGILICKYNLSDYVDNIISCILLGGVFAALTYFNIGGGVYSLCIKFAGIAFSFSLCRNITKLYPCLFSSFRDYTFQIYLMGIFFQMAVNYTFKFIGIEVLYTPLYFVSIFLALYAPVCIALIVKRINNKFISSCFGL